MTILMLHRQIGADGHAKVTKLDLLVIEFDLLGEEWADHLQVW